MRFGTINKEYPMLIGLLAAVMQYIAVRSAVVKLPCKVKKNYASAETDTKYMLYFHAGYLIRVHYFLELSHVPGYGTQKLTPSLPSLKHALR